MNEKSIETYFTKKIKDIGGLGFKLSTPGTSGIPDRLVIFKDGIVWFVELKQPKGRLEKIQKYIIKNLIKFGCNIAVLKSKGDVDIWISSLTNTNNQ